jgi:hypothetical protein
VPSPEASYQLKAEGPAGVEGLLATCRSVSAASAISGDLGGLKGVARDLVAVPAATEEPPEHVSSSYIVWN